MDTLFKPAATPFSGDRSSDATANAMLVWMSRFAHTFGTMVTPKDSVQEAIRRAVAGDVITLMPGTYNVKSPILVNKAIELRGFGRVLVSGSDTLCKLTADGSAVTGIRFSTTGTAEALQIDAARCRVVSCRITCLSDTGLKVTSNGDGSSVGDCYFDENDGHSSTSSYDIYWETGASNGRAWGNTYSTSRQYVVSYKNTDTLTQAANGVSGVVEIRT